MRMEIRLRDMSGKYEPVLNETGNTLTKQNDITLNRTVKIAKNLENVFSVWICEMTG